MPFIVPALLAAGAATAVYAATATAAAIAATSIASYFATSFLVSAVISGISMALAKNPKNPEPAVQSGSRGVTVRQAISPWEVVPGRVRKGGILTFRYINSDHRFWHMVITLACHPCQAIDQVMANDEVLSLDANGMAQGKWAKNVLTEDVTAAVVPNPPSVFVITTVTSVHEVWLDVNGDGAFWILNEVSSTPASIYEYAHPAPGTFVFHTGAIGKSCQIRTFNSTETSYIRVKISLGNENATTQPFPDLVSESLGRWSNLHKQYRHTKIYVRLEANPDLFANGVPNFTVVMRGANEILDPRTGLNGYSNNAALCLNWYLTNTEFGPGFDYATEVSSADLITAANDADTAVPLAAGGAEPRYTVNGAFSTSEQPKAVLERLLAACAGTLVDLGDQWRINMGVYHAPTVTLSERHIAGPSVINPYLPAREDANGAKGIFTNPNAHWQPDDFPALPGAGYLAADGGKRKWLDLDLTAFVTSGTQAQRLAKIALLRLRQPLAVEEVFNLSAWAAVPGRSVARTDAQLGWSAKAFEVLDSELVIAGDDNPVLAVKHSLRETAAAIYDWNTSDEGREDLAPNTNLPDVGSGLDISGLALSSGTAELFVAGDGTVISRIRATWLAAANPWLRHYEVQFKRAADTVWTAAAPVTPVSGASFSTFLSPVADGVAYNVRVRAVAVVGINGAWSQAAPHTVIGKTAPPSDVTGFSISGSKLSWSPVTDADLWGYRLRFQPGTSRSWGEAVWLHGQGKVQQDVLTTPPFTIPAGIGVGAAVLMVKAVDLSGNESLNPAYLAAFLSAASMANVLQTFDRKAAGFPGTKTNGAVDGSGNLAANGTTLMWGPDDRASMWKADATQLMWAAAAYQQMTYEDRIVTSGARAGSTLTLSAAVQGDPWSIQYRENSTKPMWAADASGLMWNAVSSTLMWDAPPYLTWPGQVTVFPDSTFDFLVTTGQGQTQGKVSGFTVTLDAPDVREFLANVAIASGGRRLPLTKSYVAIKGVTLTLVADGGTAARAQQEDASIAGPNVKCYDIAAAATSGHVNAQIEGY